MTWQKIKNSAALKTTFAILVAQLVTQGLSFITTPIFTRMMSTEEYGIVSQFNACNSIIAVLATLTLAGGVYQVAMNEFPNDRDRYTFSSLILSNFTTIIVFSILFLFLDFFTDILSLPKSLILLLFINNMLSLPMQMWICRQRYEYGYKKLLFVSIASALISQIVAVIAVLNVQNTNLGVVKLWASIIPGLLCSLVIYFIIGKKISFKPKYSYIKYAFVFNMPLLPHYLSQYALLSANQLMITFYLGTGATGIYGLAATIASIANIAWSAMSAAITPFIYENLNEENYKKINNVVISVIGVFALCCWLIALIGPEIIFILGGNKYSDGIGIIPPIAITCLLQAIYGIYSIIEFYYHKRISTSLITTVAAIINICLNIILIQKYGSVGAAYTSVIAYLVYSGLHFINYKRIIKSNKIYNNFAIWGLFAITTMGIFFVNILYSNVLLRYLALVVIVFLLAFFRKKILHLISELQKRKG